jgi:6-phosphogluconate dehydrogenase
MKSNGELGIVGLGKIGANLALQALEANFRVVGHDIHGLPDAVRSAGAVEADSPEKFLGQLSAPRKVFVYVPAGQIVDHVLDQLAEALEQGDVLVDGGNSYWGDSLRRHDRYADRGLHFVDLGTSGGIEGAAKGACFMAGGHREAIELVEPILKALAVDGGYVHAGPPGAGHFVKLVHNGIEFGMVQAIGEGMALLERYQRDRDPIDVADILRCWGHGSVIRSWLIELMERSYRAEGGLKPVPPYIEDTGEVNWLVSDAMHLEVAVPVIAQSVMQLFASRDDDQHWARAIAMMRHEFGGHPFGTDQGIAKERREGRVGPFPSAQGGNS